MAGEPSVLAPEAVEPVGQPSIDWVVPVRDRRRQERTVLKVNGSKMGAVFECHGVA